jgi:type I restriction enzyme S subunit
VNVRAVQVGECAQVINGIAFKSNLFTTERRGLPIVRIRDVIRGRSETYYTGDYPSNAVLQNGDLLIGMDGEFNIAPWQGGRALLNQRVCKIEALNGKSDISYLRYALPVVLKRIEDRTPFVTVKHLSSEELREEPIPLPELSEQKRIARLLEQADRLRRTRRYALELGGTFLPAAFLELFGDLNTNTKGWESNAFDEVCAIDAPLVDPRKPEYRNLPHLGGDNIESVTGRILRFRTAAEDGLISSKFLIGPDHILFSKIRPKLRKVSEPRMVALCSADIYPIRPRSSALKPSYLVGFLRSDYFSRIVSSVAESRTNIPKINREELSDIPVLLPPIAEQEKFAALAKRHERMLARQREALNQADHLFQSLLDRAFR